VAELRCPSSLPGPGSVAILVPRAGAWRKRHAPARGLSPWRRATPGIAILVFALGQRSWGRSARGHAARRGGDG